MPAHFGLPAQNTCVSAGLTTCDLSRSAEGCEGIFLALHQHHHTFLLTVMHHLEELFGLRETQASPTPRHWAGRGPLCTAQ